MKFIKDNLLISILIIATVVSSFWGLPRASYIDWRVIALLFNLMIVVAVFQRYRLLDYLATRLLNYCANERRLTRAMLGMCMASAMLITNDVALITFVPITLLIALKVRVNTIRLIVLQTIAANMGSSFTPLGNPQNLYLYSAFHYTLGEFLQSTFILLVLAILFLWYVTRNIETERFNLELEIPKLMHKWVLFLFMLLFILVLLSVTNFLEYQIVTVIIIILSVLLVPKVIQAVDYSLLLTFLLFFILIGNIAHIPQVKEVFNPFLSSKLATFYSSIVISQFISNVPAAVMLSPFTVARTALIWGVNVGGMGTMIASMASLISYRIYLNHFPLYGNGYLKIYLKYNLLGLIFFVPICSLSLYLYS